MPYSHKVQKKEVNLLVVDDDLIDVETIKRALSKLDIKNPVSVARDGIEALESLRGTEDQQPIAHPRLVILDLNMPRMNGLEFLEEVRSDPELRNTIIFVLTTSDDTRDRNKAYEKNIAGYLLKNHPEQSLNATIKMLEQYWQNIIFPE